ncbi:5-exo-hydroxycamphor dehydrogenase [Streptomyces sp. ADI98-12]|uniref:zinc-binding dehydrogenase n=1 Tax=Streptomyces TaxID=1883 RepID=UPI000F54EA51|nr:zinc-binding dehydrogenase [Streptomyces sp. ADI98-12]RPK80039.1 5-exo-hydroxycamphor dehydrogenase [Streptomyces sp. ADI98-12]
MSDRSPSLVAPGLTSDGITARAAVLESFQKPLTLQEFPVPAPGPGEILVDVRYGGICGTDLHLQLGHLPIPVPLVLGHEGLGSIRRLGTEGLTDANGAELRTGDTVMWASSIACGSCGPCRQHREPTLCESRQTYGVNRQVEGDSGLFGAWSETILLHPGATVVRLPQSVDPLAAMSLACAGPTLVHALYERRPVRVGEIVIVQGSGPVGMAAAALAQLSGAAMVILIGGPQQRLDLARQCGIGDVHLNIADRSDAKSALNEAREMTRGGLGADLVIECAGVPEAVAQGVYLARRGGSYLVVGQYTDSGETLFNPHQLVYRQLEVVGSWAFTGAHLVHYVNLLPALLERFDLRRLVTEFPLVEVNDAMVAVGAGEVVKAVLAGRHLPAVGT